MKHLSLGLNLIFPYNGRVAGKFGIKIVIAMSGSKMKGISSV